MNAQIYTNCLYYCVNIHETINSYYDKLLTSLVNFITTYETVIDKVVSWYMNNVNISYISNISNYEKEILMGSIIILSTLIVVFNVMMTIELLCKILNKLWKFIVEFNPYFIVNFNLNNTYNQRVNSILENLNNSIDAIVDESNDNINDESSVTNYNKNENYIDSESDGEIDYENNIYVKLTNINSTNPTRAKRYVTQRRNINTRSKKQKCS